MKHLGEYRKREKAFAKAQCIKCDRCGASSETLGPDLTTVAKRFQRKEMLESIVYPSHNISDQYAAQVATSRDRSFWDRSSLEDPWKSPYYFQMVRNWNSLNPTSMTSNRASNPQCHQNCSMHSACNRSPISLPTSNRTTALIWQKKTGPQSANSGVCSNVL